MTAPANSLSLFERSLGPEYAALPDAVRELHSALDTQRWSGQAKVTRGRSLWAWLIAGVFGFPPAAQATNVTVTITPQGAGERWERQFGTKRFRSFLQINDGKMTERFGPFTFVLGLHVSEHELHFPVQSGRLGPIPLPNRLLPISIAREYEMAGRFHFDVALKAPLTGALMVHYQGWLERE